MDIKSWVTDKVLYSSDTGDLKASMEAAIKAGANLTGASLRGTNLTGASLRGTNLRGADLRGTDLRGADLMGADLRNTDLMGADLRGANLEGATLRDAKLSELRLPTGETWEEYLRHVVPALLTAGGKTLSAIVASGAWQCHSWSNCPMHVAFDAAGMSEVPLLLRPRADQFILFFDAHLIPEPLVEAA